MTPTFARIRFLLPRNRRLNADEKSISIVHSTLPARFELVALEGDFITKSGNLVVRSSPLDTEEEASKVGHDAQLALLIAAAKIRLGVDLGTNGPKSGFFLYGLEMVRQLHGLSGNRSS